MPKKKTKAVDPLTTDPIVRSWGSSKFVYPGGLSQNAQPNPDYHPEICLTRSGKFVDVSGRPLNPKDVPQYIREEAKKKVPDAKPHRRAEIDMEDAMIDAGVDPRTGRVRAA